MSVTSELYISENTTKIHVCNILSKLHLNGRTQAVFHTIRGGLIDTPKGVHLFFWVGTIQLILLKDSLLNIANYPFLF